MKIHERPEGAVFVDGLNVTRTEKSTFLYLFYVLSVTRNVNRHEVFDTGVIHVGCLQQLRIKASRRLDGNLTDSAILRAVDEWEPEWEIAWSCVDGEQGIYTKEFHAEMVRLGEAVLKARA